MPWVESVGTGRAIAVKSVATASVEARARCLRGDILAEKGDKDERPRKGDAKCLSIGHLIAAVCVT